MAETKYNFTTKLHKCCSTDKDELRPYTKAIHFLGGYAYATEGHVLVKTSLEYHNVLYPENLDGKSIHKDNFKEILKFDVVECLEEGVQCKSIDGQVAIYEWFDLGDVKLPNFDTVIPSVKMQKDIAQIGITPKYIEMLTSAMFSTDGVFRFRFTGGSTAILVDAIGFPEQIGIVMPNLLSESIF